MINRKELIQLHNPILNGMEPDSPLTVGNGELAFTADITGMQTLYEEYDIVPLCTMAQWGWHTKPVNEEGKRYTLSDLVMTDYEWNGRHVSYPKKKMPGNERVYDWLRENPHRLNLFRLGMLWEGRKIESGMLKTCKQELHLYEGRLESQFSIKGYQCHVDTVCDQEGRDRLAFSVDSEALEKEKMSVMLSFPYGSADISASDWDHPQKHCTRIMEEKKGYVLLLRKLDGDSYMVAIETNAKMDVDPVNHCVLFHLNERRLYLVIEVWGKEAVEENLLEFENGFDKDRQEILDASKRVREVMDRSEKGWMNFWETGGIIRLNKSSDGRAMELERRIILSQYLMAVNSAGSAPPQETGLICNSWYGKMHLEMYLWHCAWLPLWNHTERMEKSIRWYEKHLPQAQENARRNGYRGARWPKMVAGEGVDCPSPVAPLLVWQQPHIIYMLELGYGQKQDMAYLKRYWTLVKETVEFMVDFVVWNPQTNCYDICAPVIPVQECHKETETKNPAFELEYFRFTLQIAIKWAKRLQYEVPQVWVHVAEHMAGLTQKDGCYLAHEKCPTTYTAFNRDHPSMVGAYGLIDSSRVDRKIMKQTLDKVMECWDYPTLWGWDFAMMAMTAVRLGEPELAIEILMKDTPKNCYLKNGNNMQITRKDLPLYLPGNGSLLLAAAMMTAGYEGCEKKTPGFPDDKTWVVEWEGIHPFPKEINKTVMEETYESL